MPPKGLPKVKMASLVRTEAKFKRPAKRADPENCGILEGISSLHTWIKTQTMIRPHQKQTGKKGQITVYEEDPDEDVIITLTAQNPQAPQSQVRFDYTNGEYVQVKFIEYMIDHLEIESTSLHKDSHEALEQLQMDGAVRDAPFKSAVKNMVKKEKIVGGLLAGSKAKRKNEKSDDEDEDEDEDDKDADATLDGKTKGPSNLRRDSIGSDTSSMQDKKLQNQFSFLERATQTMNNSTRHLQIQTEPPLRAGFSETVNQWVIYDAYVNYEYQKEMQEEKDKSRSKKEETNNAIKKLLRKREPDRNVEINKKLFKAARILERMVNQNIYNDIAQDFRFWEDASDEFREIEGTLLPLWTFNFERAKNLEITSLCWNAAYKDLFAAGFGSYNFYQHETTLLLPGVVCIFSLKNPSYPEYLCIANSGVTAVDIHPNHPHMLAVGMADGNVAVYNLQKNTTKPSYISSAKNGKHQDLVWQIKWAKDNLDGYLTFYSVSGDGRVTNWTIVKTALWYNDTLNINFSKTLKNFSTESSKVILKDGGRCVAFNTNDETIFLVGTDEGLIYKCTTEYSSRFLQMYPAHNTPIYNIHWNSFVPSIFISCAAEWMIKIWDHNSTKPLFMFDLNSQVGDVAWAPYSSTVFAAVTVDGKVHVFDLHIDKYHPICCQQVVPRKRARLNHIAFNPHHPIIIVGDSRGSIQCLKLSPNLRRHSKDMKNAVFSKDPKKILAFETKKLEVLLAMVKEPDDKEVHGGEEVQETY